MSDSGPKAGLRGLAGRAALAAPWAASFALHAAAVGVAVGGLRTGLVGPPQQAGVPVSFGDPVEQAPSRPSPAERQPVAETHPPAAEPGNAASSVQRVLPAPEIEVVATLAPSLPPLVLPTDPLAITPTEEESGPVVAPEFFALRGSADARRIVYVVDASGSMVSALPLVVGELRRSIERLSTGQWFQVLFFKSGRFEQPMGLPDDALIRATDANKRAVFNWMDRIAPERTGDPKPALERAMQFRPDVVFLLSKGIGDAGLPAQRIRRENDEILARLDQWNPPVEGTGRRKATIKVIQFFDPDAGGLLHEIAMRHGGPEAFTFIPRGDAAKEP